MIDIGLSKLALIGVVALVVIGPERLPKVARMAGTLFGRAQRYINDVKSEVSREIELDELRKMQKDVEQAASDVSGSIHKSMSDTEASINDAWNGGDSASAGSVESGAESWKRTPNADLLSIKAKAFRRKKLARTTAVPSWYKHQSGRKTRVISASARVAKYRPISASKSAGFF
ncbi:Sec-independent protein translocase protein TatB [Herbaspirillum sp. WKF16]|jgi:sec-independent protein translocase protein TatB|uniref:Sec-independent protein translocase protein TatB n=1 Tax=Herbaspirillum sp. WKF16 TaxID=3028312 RepID=UPI0023A92EB7|nr:Sec-independent protein translocase protein TatB [Herbaspirillum sp. WKF16]WDZ95488.1 Sec-independent protein translocase protein TatB [Herbaspirillum sp. WKF16]